MSLTDVVLENPWVYRLWQAPFVNQKLAPLFAHNNLRVVQRVLDVGCGPGTNAPLFQNISYLGIDINPKYIDNARRRYKGDFVVADVTKYHADSGSRFDFILVNSILHHIDTLATERILSHLHQLLTPDGHVHMLELVLPDSPGIARMLAKHDRGKFARAQTEWVEIFSRHFAPVVVEPYSISALGVPLWHMIYFKGRPLP